MRWSFVLFVCLAACSDGTPGGSDAAIGCTQPKSQGPSEPCCLNLGIDACGANLFCAAFDGRTQPTCYPNHSRVDLSTCADDLQCASGKCNSAQQKCASTPRAACTAEVGCAPDSNGVPYYCVDQSCAAVSGTGSCADICGVDGDCVQSHACSPTLHRCLCVSDEYNCDKSGCLAPSTCSQACPGGVGDGWCCL